VRARIDEAGFVRSTGNTVQWAGKARSVERFDAGLFGLQVSRDRFDALLLAAAEASGASVRRDTAVTEASRDASGVWRVTYHDGSATITRHARWVLDCSGRAGVLARRGWRRPRAASRTIAVAGVWERGDAWPIEDDSHTLVESYDNGWAWSVPVSRTRRYVTVMLDPSITAIPARATLEAAYRAELMRTTMLRDLVADAILTEVPWGCDASPYSADRFSDDGVLLVGDAGSFVDPLSSFGIKKALASAWLAAVAVHSAIGDTSMSTPALDLFSRRERSMYEHLQHQSAALSRDAAGAHESPYWASRGETNAAPSDGDLDMSALRNDSRITAAFDALKRAPSVRLRLGDSLMFVERAMVRGNRIVLERHLAGPQLPSPVRYCSSVDLLLVTQLANGYDQVPDIFDAYNRSAPPAPLPDFLGALSTLVGLGLLSLA
jgi:flavin-dependent dehydrogenase